MSSLRPQGPAGLAAPTSFLPLTLIESHCVVAQSCPTLCNLMDYNLPGSSVRGILQAEWVVMPSSTGSSRPRDRTYAGLSRFFIAEIPEKLWSHSASSKPLQ